MDGEAIQNPWLGLNQLTGQGSIASLTIERAHHLLLKHWTKEDIDAVRVSIAFLHLECTLFCMKHEEVKTLCTALALAQEWRIKTLYLPNDIASEAESAEVWEALSQVADSGKVDTFMPVAFVKCETAEEVITLCSALAFANRWKIEELHLPNNIEAEAWEALCKEAVRGDVKIVCNGSVIAQMKEGDYDLEVLQKLHAQAQSQATKKCCQLV